MVFRVFIDHADGVDLDLCEKASRMISGILDREDPIPQAYTLEVSSPGLDRVLKKDRDFERFSGHKVKLKTFEAIDGQKKFTGTLVGLIDGKIILETEEKRVSIPRESTTQVRLVVDL
jgi:ribosome maturation factor RimP